MPTRTRTVKVFLSYAGEDGFEAELLQICLEHLLKDVEASVWTYERDQGRDERSVAASLPDRIKESSAAVILISGFTLDSGATQWMELAYADAFKVPTFILLHHLSYAELKRSEKGVPPLVLQGQCTAASDWKSLESGLREACLKTVRADGPGTPV